ncbi:response regulator [Vibrio rumoiensis]|uniref:Two-component system response regulator n=1 Tax=Vibrio rumoiensis 1S-45 TaxID=1188252 RepID=A0A1E5E1M1_9VIBR|nr:response regulator [Vibrio rumoiensis]OEF25160.1 two-component system response regulator [Vibrio rumoiensis 1S-45]
MHNSTSQLQRVNIALGSSMQTIMLVDDDPIFRNMIASYLKSLHYEVVEAQDGLEALQLLREHVPDLMICDLNMPIVSGVELVEEVSWQFPMLPMIVVSATEDMADVAQVLRFGIKDFLTKPITRLEHFTDAIKTTLDEAQSNTSFTRDFSSQWFRVDQSGEVAEEKELYWHLNHLKDNTVTARDLLHALQPERDTQQGGWKCSYLVLQSSETMPLVFDYSWLMDGRFAFYLVDSSAGGENGVGTALLVRALFNDFIRTRKRCHSDLKDLADAVEKGISCTQCADSIPAIFGIADMVEGTISILPAGLKSHWIQQGKNQAIETGIKLGEGCTKNFVTSDLPMKKGGELVLSELGVRSFKLTIKNLVC